MENKINDFFNQLAINRDNLIEKDPILNYEQKMRQFYINKLLEVKPGESILDAGCGTCQDAKLYLNKNVDYVGIDMSFSMLSEAIKSYSNKKVSLFRGNCLLLPFKEKTFDNVVCSEVLEHIPDWKLVLKALKYVLKENGTLIISTPNKFSVYYPQRLFLEKRKGLMHPYDEWKNYWILKKELGKLGFEIVEVYGACYLPGLIVYKENIKRIFANYIPILERIEKTFLSRYVMKYFGYMIIIKAKLKNEQQMSII